jgi:predicted nucleotidyltransferase
MRTAAPPLLPIFRSRLQGELLGAILLEPERSESLTDLARRLEADVGTIQREVSRLEQAGILQTRRVGNTRLVGANTASPIYRPLAELVLKAFGPAQVVAEEFAQIQEVREIYIFGSWAARYQGEEGPTPADVDVLIIGSPDRDEVYQAALRSERRLGREVNTTIRSKATWQSARDGFVRQVRSSPIVPVRSPDRAETRGE